MLKIKSLFFFNRKIALSILFFISGVYILVLPVYYLTNVLIGVPINISGIIYNVKMYGDTFLPYEVVICLVCSILLFGLFVKNLLEIKKK
jgi:cytochrome bd-type quinol oxidase subunit 2